MESIPTDLRMKEVSDPTKARQVGSFYIFTDLRGLISPLDVDTIVVNKTAAPH